MMRVLIAKRAVLGALCGALLALAVGVSPASGEAPEPDEVFFAPKDEPQKEIVGVPPGNGFSGACGIAVDIGGNFYVSDYYHHNVDIFTSALVYQAQLTKVDPLSGPCGLALDTNGVLYVNGYHRNVQKFALSGFPPTASTTFFTGPVISTVEPTGVAVDTTTNNAYVNERSAVALFDPAGNQLATIGEPSLGDGYGIAVSSYPATEGRVYVPDAATDTVKVYDPSINEENPIGEITGPPGGFQSLRDSAVAVDRTSGEIYVADRVGTELTEHPESAIYVFNSAGAFTGRLKYNVVDAKPVGIAVDNSAGANQGRVYVTSGNSEDSSVYIYPPGSVTEEEAPATLSLSLSSMGSGSGSIASSIGDLGCSGSCSGPVFAAAQVTLIASPDPGSSFEGWSGAGCSGADQCTVSMTQATSVMAEFSVPPGASAPISTSPVGTNAIPGAAPPTSQAPAFRASKRKKAKRSRKRAKRTRGAGKGKGPASRRRAH